MQSRRSQWMRDGGSSIFPTTLVALVLGFSQTASAQECESGTSTSAAGTIIDIYPDDLTRGWDLFANVAIRSCDFEYLWFQDEPAQECAPGASFVANGTISHGFEVTLDVEHIVCIPQ
jgi:hypothetical protein